VRPLANSAVRAGAFMSQAVVLGGGDQRILVQAAFLTSDLIEEAPVRGGIAEAPILMVTQRGLAADRLTTSTAHPLWLHWLRAHAISFGPRLQQSLGHSPKSLTPFLLQTNTLRTRCKPILAAEETAYERGRAEEVTAACKQQLLSANHVLVRLLFVCCAELYASSPSARQRG
jgi:hypothetical protein